MTLGRVVGLRNIGAVSQLAALVEKGGQRGEEPCLLWHTPGTNRSLLLQLWIQLGDECRSFPKRQKSFLFQFVRDRASRGWCSSRLQAASFLLIVYSLFGDIKLYYWLALVLPPVYSTCQMQQQSELEHTLCRETIPVGEEQQYTNIKRKKTFLWSRLRGLLTDIYLQNVIREVRSWGEGAKIWFSLDRTLDPKTWRIHP